MISLVTIALVLALAGTFVGAFVRISLAIVREDRNGTLAHGAPGWAEQSARSITGWHRARWA
jgi:hypothetical protein